MRTCVWTVAVFVVFGMCNVAYSADNYALMFHGDQEYVECGSENLPDGTSARTVEVWFKTDYAGADMKQILSYGEAGTLGALFGLMTRQGNLSFTQWGADLTGQTLINDGEWHHAAISYDGQEHTMYLDGNPEAAGNPQPFDTVLNNCNIACWYIDDGNLGEFFEGIIDEARIWSVAKTQEEIQDTMGQALIGNEPGLVSYWNFDEGEGGALNELTASGNDGEIIGSPEWVEGAPVESASVDITGKLFATWASIKQE